MSVNRKYDIFDSGEKSLYTGGMTLRDLLIEKGIKRPVDFARTVGLTRQYAHLLWTGQRLITRTMAKKIYDATGIPIPDLLMAEPLPYSPRRKPRTSSG